MSDQGVAVGQLRAFVERVERVEEEIKTLNDDKSEIYKEMRGFGFDVKAVRKVVAKRKLDPSVRDEQDAMFDLYWDALTGSVHVHTPAREIIEEFDPEAGEITASHGTASDGVDPSHDEIAANMEQGDVDSSALRASSDVKVVATNSPETATTSLANVPCDAVSERAAILVASETSVAEAGVSGQPEMIPVLTGQFPGANVSSPERAGVTAGETAPQFTPPSFLVKKSISDFRPHCQKPDACGASGLKHCYSCSKLIPAESEAA